MSETRSSCHNAPINDCVDDEVCSECGWPCSYAPEPAKPQPPADGATAEAMCKHCGKPIWLKREGVQVADTWLYKQDGFCPKNADGHKPAAPEPRSEPRRLDSAGRDVTDLPGLWDEDDVLEPATPPEPPQIPDEVARFFITGGRQYRYNESDRVALREMWESALAGERAENQKLRAVISTPEVWAGVVTEECEKHWAELIAAERSKREAAETALAKVSLHVNHRLSELNAFKLDNNLSEWGKGQRSGLKDIQFILAQPPQQTAKTEETE